MSAMYNALQVKIDRRFAGSLGITTSLTYQKGMAYYNGGDDDGFYGFYLNGQYHRNWGLNDFNRTLSFVQSYVYQLPFGKGKHFLNSGPRGLDKIVGGWQLEGILTVMTGLPFTVTYSSTYLNLASGGTNTPIQVGPANILHGINTTSNGGSPWFDPTAFAPPPCQSATPSASCPTGAIDQVAGAAQQVGNVGRNSMIGPGLLQPELRPVQDHPVHRAHRHAASAGNRKHNQHPAVRQSERHLLHREQRQLRIRDQHLQHRLWLGQLRHRRPSQYPVGGEVDVLAFREVALATGAAPAAPVAIALFRDDPAFAGRKDGAVAPVQEQHSQFFNAGSTIDDNLSDKDRLSGRFSFSRPVVFQAPLVGMAGGDGPGTAFMDTLEFRAETFNLTNTPQFSNPSGSLTASTFGIVTGTVGSGTGVNGTGGGRAMQLSVKVSF